MPSCDCRHAVCNGRSMTCKLLPHVRELAGPGSPNFACEVFCKPGWIDGREPDEADAALPPFLVELRAASKPQEPLTLPQRLRTAWLAFRAFVASGGVLLDDKAVADRRAICRTCEHRGTVFGRMDICNRCGCFLRFKMQLPHEHCPGGLWPGDPEGGCGGCGQ